MLNIPLDTDNEDQLGLIVNVEVTLLAGSAGQADLLTLSVAVLLDVGLSALEDNATLLLVGLYESKSVQSFHIVLVISSMCGIQCIRPERWLTGDNIDQLV